MGAERAFRARLTCRESGRRAWASGGGSGAAGSPGLAVVGTWDATQVLTQQAAQVPAARTSATPRAQGSGRQAGPGGAGGRWASGSRTASVWGHMAGGGRLQPGPGPRAL